MTDTTATNMIGLIVRMVTDKFIATGEASSAREIANMVGLGEKKVRAMLYLESPPELCSDEELRESNYALSNYCGAKYHKVTTYSPTRKHLAALLKAART